MNTALIAHLADLPIRHSGLYLSCPAGLDLAVQVGCHIHGCFEGKSLIIAASLPGTTALLERKEAFGFAAEKYTSSGNNAPLPTVPS